MGKKCPLKKLISPPESNPVITIRFTMLWHAILAIRMRSAFIEKLVSSKVFKGAIFLIISYLSLDSNFLTFWRLLGFRFPIRPWKRLAARSNWSTGVKTMFWKYQKRVEKERPKKGPEKVHSLSGDMLVFMLAWIWDSRGVVPTSFPSKLVC